MENIGAIDSGRIKRYRRVLKKEIKSFLNGKTSVNKIEKAIRDKYSTGAGQTSRLIENEVARCQSEVNEYFSRFKGL